MEIMDRISVDNEVCSGKACIEGTRIPVHIIVDLLAAGETFERILEEYPHITEEDIKACLSYAAYLTDVEAGVVA